MNYKVPNNLLSTANAKTIKGEKLGYTTYIMYLAPHTQNSKGINLCSHASKGCAKACLFGSGAARFEEVQNGKRGGRYCQYLYPYQYYMLYFFQCFHPRISVLKGLFFLYFRSWFCTYFLVIS